MPSLRLVRRYRFAAAHRLHTPLLSDEVNRDIYGKCNNPYGHGHNYELEVKVTGEVDPDTGYVVDLGWLSKLIETEIEERFDHKNLNVDVPEFQGRLTSAENIAVVIWDLLRAQLHERYDLKVRLYETPRNFVEYPA